jgi:hypothetical protein
MSQNWVSSVAAVIELSTIKCSCPALLVGEDPNYEYTFISSDSILVGKLRFGIEMNTDSE